MQPRPLPKVPTLDIAYLGGVIAETAGLPLDPALAAGRDLRGVCNGAFHTCDKRPAVDAYLSALASGGQLQKF